MLLKASTSDFSNTVELTPYFNMQCRAVKAKSLFVHWDILLDWKKFPITSEAGMHLIKTMIFLRVYDKSPPRQKPSRSK
jgi:hypothetical protein